MPFIVLFHEVFDKFAKAVKKLERWNELVDLEILLVARGRSAFLVHWFGSLIPLDGSSIRIAIVNFEALRRRYSLVMSKRRSKLSQGPSMLEPLADISGAFAGAAVSPLHFFSIVAYTEPYIEKIDKTALRVLAKIGLVLNELSLGALGPIAFIFLAAAGPAVILGFAGVPGTAEVQDFLTALTRIAKPLTEFWRQVTGPRDKVKNPIVRATLRVLDKLAVMFPFFMATVAFLIGKVGPLLDPLFRQFQALGAFMSEVFDLASFVGKGLVELLQNWLKLLPYYLKLAVKAFGCLIDFLSTGLTVRLFGVAQGYLDRMGTGLSAFFNDVQDWAQKRFAQIVAENPLIIVIKRTIDQLKKIKVVLDLWSAKPTKKDDEEPGVIARQADKVIAALKSKFDPVAADIEWMKQNVPHFKGDVDIQGMLRDQGLSPFPLMYPLMKPTIDPFADVRTKFRSRPRSIFAGEREALQATAVEQFQMPSVAMSVEAAHIDETHLREALLDVAKRVLPPEMQPYLKILSDTMESAEKALDQKPVPEGARKFPVLSLPEDERLRPVVSRLRVRVHGGARALAEEWTAGLKATLLGQLYPMPLAEGGGANAH